MRIRYLYLIIIITNTIKLYSTELGESFSNIGVNDGLSHGWVTTIIQDKQGFMWFGTNDGLNKYDGKDFQVYRQQPGDTQSLCSNFVSILFEDADGNIWIGTNTGLNFLNIKSNQISRIKTDGEYYITDITQIDSNRLAIACYNGLFICNIKTHKLHQHLLNADKPNTYWNRFRSLIHHTKQIITFAKGGIYQFNLDSNRFKLMFADTNEFLGINVGTSLLKNDILWMGTTSDGLYYIDLKHNGRIKKVQNPKLKNTTIFSIFSLNKKEILIGTENQGIYILDISHMDSDSIEMRQIQNQFNAPMGLINNSIHAIYKDIQNNLWFGTYNGISYQFGNGLSFNSIISQANNDHSLHNNMVNCILEKGETIWVGTENGIDIYDNEFKTHTYLSNKGPNALLGSAIMSMIVDDYGNTWVGSWTGGIDIINPFGKIINHITSDGHSNVFAVHSVMSMSKDKNGDIWIGTMGAGLYVYEKATNRFRQFKFSSDDENSLSNDWIKCVMISSKNEVWVSTHTSLNVFNRDTEIFKVFNPSDNSTKAIAGSGIVCMHEDYRGNLWFGSPSGLSQFIRKDSSFINYYTTDGLPNNHIQSIESDQYGNLWIGTNYGLSKMIFPKTSYEKINFENYDNRDGLIGNLFTRRSSLKTKDGQLFFGTKQGLVYFNPINIQSNYYIPKVFITNLFVNNIKIEPNDASNLIDKDIAFIHDLNLNHDQSNLAFTFTALNYVVSGKNKYKYKLIGFDKDWKTLNNESKATYTNIPHGDYVFHVKGSNNNGFWNEEGAKLNVHITPPWYKTKLAYLGYLSIIFLLILSYRHFIVIQTKLESKLKLEIIEKENLNHLNKVKTKFFTNISHEFLTPLALIISPLESIANDAEITIAELQQKIHPIYRNAKRLQRLINQLLDISKVEADHIELRVMQDYINVFTNDIFVGFKDLAANKNISFTYNTSAKQELIYFDKDKIEKILYNLLSNAIKFTPVNGVVSLQITQSEEYISFNITDNGIGISQIDKEKVFDSFYRSTDEKKNFIEGTGIGLSLVKGLVNLYGGSISLTSEHGQGSTFIVNLPYHKHQFNETNIVSSEDESLILNYSDNNFHLNIIDEIDIINNESLANILIIEDNIELNDHLMDLLKKTYNVYSAFNGLQGYERAFELIPDIIISDIVMPKMNGIDLLQKIRSTETISHIPVILLTAKVGVENQIEGLNFGADAYLTKPFDQKHLNTTISSLIKNRAQLKEKYKKNIVVGPSQVNITSVDEKFITKSIKLVEENLSNPNFTVEMLASEIGMSRVQLHRKLTGLLDMSASNFIREIKIKRAEELLTKGQLTVSEVMYEVNIKSRAYFTKCFKEKYNMLPMEYVKAKKENHKA